MKVLVFVIAFFGLTGCMENKDSSEKIHQRLQKQLPVGASREQANRALTAEGFEHSWFNDERLIRAVRRNLKGSNAVVKEGLSVVIRFDEQERIKSVEAKPVLTGP
jgi:hypothetical protein